MWRSFLTSTSVIVLLFHQHYLPGLDMVTGHHPNNIQATGCPRTVPCYLMAAGLMYPSYQVHIYFQAKPTVVCV